MPPNAGAEVTTALAALDSVIDSVAGDTAVASQFQLAGGPAPAAKFVDVNAALVSQLKAQDYADQAPTPAMLAGWAKSCEALGAAMRRWQRVGTEDLETFTAVLRRNQIAAVVGFDKGRRRRCADRQDLARPRVIGQGHTSTRGNARFTRCLTINRVSFVRRFRKSGLS